MLNGGWIGTMQKPLLMAAKGLVLIFYACLPDNVGNRIKYVQFYLLPSALPILPNLQKMAA